jgi:hypothetical protein
MNKTYRGNDRINPTTRFRLALAGLCGVLLLPGCSLLNFKIDTGAVPLSDAAINTRVMTRASLPSYFSAVEQAADQLIDAEVGEAQQLNALAWKVSSEAAAMNAVLQPDSTLALVDFWLLTRQQDDFFREGAGSQLFGTRQSVIVGASTDLHQRASALAEALLGAVEHQRIQAFVDQQAAEQPFEDLSFRRQPQLGPWLAFNNIAPDQAIATVGSMPQTIADLSDRVSLMSQQMPKSVGWKAQWAAQRSGLQGRELRSLVANLNRATDQLVKLTEPDPERNARLAARIREELGPILVHMEVTLQAVGEGLSYEREQLTASLKQGREALEAMVARERAIVLSDTDRISKEVVEKVFAEVKGLIGSVLVLLAVFVLVLVFVPFFAGYKLGARGGTRA